MLPDYHTGSLIGICVQRFLRTWKELFSRSPFADFTKALATYKLFGNRTCQYRALTTRLEDLSSLSQLKILVDVCCPFKGEKGVDIAAFYRLENKDHALS